jgi:hypothetical protein
MAQVPIDAALVAPIPIGHRVRVTHYLIEVGSLFGTSRRELPYEPVIEDLDTGIVYASDRVYASGGVKYADRPVEIQREIVGTVLQVVEGVVASCRVITVRSFSEADVQTHLVLET